MTQELEKMRLCLNEMLFLQEILNRKVADDLSARMLGIYVLIRMDDFTKFAKSIIATGSNSAKTSFEELFNLYNKKGRPIRDKLGAHMQTPNSPKDYSAVKTFDGFFSRINLYQSVDYKLIDDFVDFAVLVYQEFGGGQLIKVSADFDLAQDLSLITETLTNSSLSDKVQLASDWFGISAPNTVFMISGTDAQRKGQLLKSLELMEGKAYELNCLPLMSSLAQFLFKRLWICIVMNYYDNMFSRTDLKVGDVREENGFDEMAPLLSDKHYSTDDIKRFFSSFKDANKCFDADMCRLRSVRDTSCGHLDENKTIVDIESALASVNNEMVRANMNRMTDLFHYVCREVFVLKMLDIPARSPVFDSVGTEPSLSSPFYKKEEESVEIKPMNVDLAWRVFRKKAEGWEDAKHFLARILFNPRDKLFHELATVLIDWLSRNHIEADDANACADLIISSKRGYPRDLQDIVIDATCEAGKLTPLTLLILSEIAVDSERIKVIVQSCLKSEHVVIRTYGALIQLKIDEANHTPITWQKDCQPSNLLSDYYKPTSSTTEDLALALVLAQQWNFSLNYSASRRHRKTMSALVETQLSKRLSDYLQYTKASKELSQDCNRMASLKRYFSLLYRLILWEKERNQKPNHFVGILVYNQFAVAGIDDLPELACRALCYDAVGSSDTCAKLLEELTHRYPTDETITTVYNDYLTRRN